MTDSNKTKRIITPSPTETPFDEGEKSEFVQNKESIITDSNKAKRIISLSPTETLFDKGEKSEFVQYKEVLDEAFKNKGIHNIAITGSFGVGKSSIIHSYEKNDSNKNDGYLFISLADFRNDSKDNPGISKEKKSELQQEFERYLLCQILARSNGIIMPQSNYRLIPGKYEGWVRIGIAFLISILFFIWFLIARQANFEFSKETVKFMGWTFAILATLVIIIAVYYLLGFLKSVKLSAEYRNVKLETESSIPETGSYIDDNIFEIIYALEKLAKSIGYTVVLEDFDRLGDEICVDIFSKMRRINYLVNDRKIIKQHMRFIYAFDDSVFKLTKNTKFFDYILSVTPQLNYANAGNALKNSLINNFQSINKNDHIIQTLNEYDDEFWNKVGLIVNDYRTLNHIQNEFSLFLHVIRERQKTDNKIQSNSFKEDEKKYLPYIIYKNVMPDDYSNGLREKTILEIDKDARDKRIDVLYGQFGTTYADLLKSLMNYLIDKVQLSKEYYYSFTGATNEVRKIKEENNQNNEIKEIVQYRAPFDEDNIGDYLDDKSILIVLRETYLGFELISQILRYNIKRADIFVREAEAYAELKTTWLSNYKQVNIITQTQSTKASPIDYCSSVPDIVIFMGSDFKNNPGEIVREELLTPYNLMKKCVDIGVKYFLYCSHFIINKNGFPPDINMITHAMLAHLAHEMVKQSTIIKAINLNGFEKEFDIFKRNVQKQIDLGGPITLKDSNQFIWCQSLQKTCYLILKALFMNNNYNEYSFDFGKEVKAVEITNYLIENAGYEAGKSMEIVYTGLRPGEKLLKNIFDLEVEGLFATEDREIFGLRRFNESIDYSYALDRIIYYLKDHKYASSLTQSLESEIRPQFMYLSRDDIDKVITEQLDKLDKESKDE